MLSQQCQTLVCRCDNPRDTPKKRDARVFSLADFETTV
jgi:hypothetical protein